MKKAILIACVFVTAVSYAQQKQVNQAVINTTTTVTSPDESEDVANIQAGDGGAGNRMVFRNFADGETKSVTYLKNELVKTILRSDIGRSTIIRDNAAKKTTTLIEMMGNKTGFYTTDEEAAGMRKRMDSMMSATRTSADSGRRMVRNEEVPTEIVYTEETKKIAGYQCKKAYIVATRILGIKDSTAVWYTPELKLNNVTSTGGMAGFAAMMPGSGGSLAALTKIDGFVMSYQSKMPRNRTMTVEVTKIDLNKEIADKEFDIPKDFEIKPMSELRSMMQGGPGGGQIRMMRTN